MKYTCLGLKQPNGYVRATAVNPPQIIYRFKDETGQTILQDFYTDIKKQYSSLNLGLVTEVQATKIGNYLSRQGPMDLCLDSHGNLILPVIPNLYDIIHY